MVISYLNGHLHIFGFLVQAGLINKFKERWDRLKESAKRKKDAKAKAVFDKNAVAEPIDEEPEAEAAAEEQERGLH